MKPDSALSGLIDDIVTAFERRDVARLQELVHPEAVISPLPSPTPLHGREGVTAYIEGMKRRIGTVTVSAVRPLSDQSVLIEGREQYQDSASGLFDRSAAWIVEFREGMIWRTRNFTSTDAALAAWRDDSPPA